MSLLSMADTGKTPPSAKPEPASYKSFKGAEFRLYPWPGKKILFLTQSSALSPTTMKGLCDVFDGVWAFYREATGREPEPRSLHEGRLTIAEVADTYGAACGYLGMTGIEMTPHCVNDLLVAFEKSGEVDQALPYEFGRNFWFYSDPLDYIHPDSGHSVVTGYAVFMRLMALDAVGRDVGPFRNRSGRHFRLVMEGLVESYEADPKLTWANTILTGEAPPNALGLNGTDLFASFCLRLTRDYGGMEFVKRLWKEAGTRPKALTTQDAVDNFVIAASYAARKDLSGLFAERWRWPVSDSARKETASLPRPSETK